MRWCTLHLWREQTFHITIWAGSVGYHSAEFSVCSSASFITEPIAPQWTKELATPSALDIPCHERNQQNMYDILVPFFQQIPEGFAHCISLEGKCRLYIDFLNYLKDIKLEQAQLGNYDSINGKISYRAQKSWCYSAFWSGFVHLKFISLTALSRGLKLVYFWQGLHFTSKGSFSLFVCSLSQFYCLRSLILSQTCILAFHNPPHLAWCIDLFLLRLKDIGACRSSIYAGLHSNDYKGVLSESAISNSLPVSPKRSNIKA